MTFNYGFPNENIRNGLYAIITVQIIIMVFVFTMYVFTAYFIVYFNPYTTYNSSLNIVPFKQATTSNHIRDLSN